VVKETYHHKDDPGRPPRKPMGIFKALIAKRLQQIPSERELCRRLWKDDDLRELCDIEAEQNPYHPSQLSRFRKRVGARRLQRIMNKLLKELLKGGVINGETVVLDATFVKAYSRRDPHENSRGKSDPEARVGRNGKTYDLGYKLHVAADSSARATIDGLVNILTRLQNSGFSSLNPQLVGSLRESLEGARRRNLRPEQIIETSQRTESEWKKKIQGGYDAGLQDGIKAFESSMVDVAMETVGDLNVLQSLCSLIDKAKFKAVHSLKS